MLTKLITARVSNLSRRALSVSKLGGSVITPGDEAAYANLLQASGKKIIYFTATWCPPCKRIAPVFDKIAKDTVGAAFIKIDVDQLSDAAAAAGIQSVPTFQFRDGQKTLFEFCGADEEMLKLNVRKLVES